MDNAENQNTPRSSEQKKIIPIIGTFVLIALIVAFMQWNKSEPESVQDGSTFKVVEEDAAETAAVTIPAPDTPETIVAAVTDSPSTADPVIAVEPEPERRAVVEVDPNAVPTVDPSVEEVAEQPDVADETEASVAPEVAVEPEVAVVEAPEPEVIVPSFDLVRVDSDGSAVVAGAAAPNSTVRLMADGKEIAVTQAGNGGSFAFVTRMPEGTDPMQLQLEQDGDTAVKSIETVLVMPSPVGEKVAPMVVVAEEDGKVVVQEQGELGPNFQALSLDTINYSASGDVVFTGRGTSEQSVRVYVDNQPVVLGPVSDGSWSFEIPDIKEGVYTVRVDAVDEAGKVVERVESPFQRVVPEEAVGQVTIQPGFTLWALAENKYGSGQRYVQIFEANRELIKDPDMIFPGQIFKVPEE